MPKRSQQDERQWSVVLYDSNTGKMGFGTHTSIDQLTKASTLWRF